MAVVEPNLSVEIAGLSLKNPVMTASGTFGYGEEFAEFFDLSRLGALVVKGLSLRPKKGNPTPRIVETPSGMLNAIGLQNIGVEEFVVNKLPFLRGFDTKIIVNFFGDTLEEFIETAKILDSAQGVHALELNVSCPNKQKGWINFGSDPTLLRELIVAIKREVKKPLIVKLSPNTSDIRQPAIVARESGADALSLINTLTGMVIDIRRRRPVLANNTGGLSGPAIRPVAVRMVWEVCSVIDLPVIGMGGIIKAEDALEFLIAGARAVAVGTANFVNPLSSISIIEGLKEFMIEQDIRDINQLIGSLKVHRHDRCD